MLYLCKYICYINITLKKAWYQNRGEKKVGKHGFIVCCLYKINLLVIGKKGNKKNKIWNQRSNLIERKKNNQ